MKYCLSCGAKNETLAKFCSSCGKSFGEATPAQAAKSKLQVLVSQQVEEPEAKPISKLTSLSFVIEEKNSDVITFQEIERGAVIQRTDRGNQTIDQLFSQRQEFDGGEE